MSEVKYVTEINIPELEVYAKLTEVELRNKLEPEKGIFIAEGPKVIDLAIEGGCEPLSLLMEERYLATQGKVLLERYPRLTAYVGERSVLASLTGYKLTRGILSAMLRPKALAPEELFSKARTLAILDGLTDATNVGAIFRSAAALDVDGVVVMDSSSDPLCRRSVRVSMGTIFQVPWVRFSGSVKELEKWGYTTLALALTDDSLSLIDPSLLTFPKLALVFGSEGYGLSPKTIEACQYRVKIPMSHGVDSLNVAAASAVAFWQLCAGRGITKENNYE